MDPRLQAGLNLILSEYGEATIARIVLAEIDANIPYRSDGVHAVDQRNWKIVKDLRALIEE